MSKRDSYPKGADATSLDLHDHSRVLGQVLPVLLFAGDRDALLRWSKVRTWIDNAIAGDSYPDLLVIDLAVAYLAERASETD